MNVDANAQREMMQRKQRLEMLQSARKWQPSDSIEAAKLDSEISTVRGVILLLEWHEADYVRS